MSAIISSKNKMKKIATFIALMVFALVLSGCGKGNQQSAETNQEQKQVTSDSGDDKQSGENKFTGSIKDLLGMGKSLKCTASSSSDKFSSSGTTYISGEKVRSDVVSHVEGAAKETIMHSIILDGIMYSWKEGESTGMKLDINKMKENLPPASSEANQSEGALSSENQLDDKTDFDCSSWSVDESLFAVPTDVNFTDQAAVMNSIKSKIEQKNQNMCDVCGSIQNTEAKRQCEEACKSQ
jgi:hypothetical protein